MCVCVRAQLQCLTWLKYLKASMKNLLFGANEKLLALCPRFSKCKVLQRWGCQHRLTSLHWVLTANLPDGELLSRDGEIPRLTCLNTTQNKKPADSTHRWEALLLRLCLRRLCDKKKKKKKLKQLFVFCLNSKKWSTVPSAVSWRLRCLCSSLLFHHLETFLAACSLAFLRWTMDPDRTKVKIQQPASSAVSSGHMRPSVQRDICWYRSAEMIQWI